MNNRARFIFPVLATAVLTTAFVCQTVAAEELEAEELTEAAPQEITYWSMWEEEEKQAEVIQDAADAYEDSTGIHVNIQWKGRGIQDLIGAALDAGEKIDLFDDDYQRVVQQDREYVADLKEYGSTVDYETHMVPAFLNQMKEWGDGEVYAFPYQPYIVGVWYDKDLWEEAGLTTEDIPDTWGEFLQVCKKIQDSETGLQAMTCDEDSVDLLYGMQLLRYLGQEKVQKLVENCAWSTTPEALTAAQDIQTLFQQGYMSSQAPGQDKEGQNEIGEGKTVMELQASWMPGEVLEETGTQTEWGYFSWPMEQKDGEKLGTIAGAQGFAVTKESQMKQEAFDFAYLVCTGEYDLALAQKVNSIPADTDNWQWPTLIAGAKDSFEQLQTVYMWAAGLEANNTYKDLIQENLLRLVKQDLTPEKFIQELGRKRS